MNKRFFSVVTALLLASGGILYAAEGDSSYASAQAKVKAKFPKEFAEVEKLAATDMRAAMRKLMELAAKAEVKMPGSGRFQGREGGRRNGRRVDRSGGRGRFGGQRQMRGRSEMGRNPRGGAAMGGMNIFARLKAEAQIAEKFPAEFAAAVKQMNESEKAMNALAEKAGVKLPVGMDVKIRMLDEKAPAAMAAIRKSLAGDPRGAFSALRSLAEKHGIELMERNEERGQRPGFGRGRGAADRSSQPAGREMFRPAFPKLRAAFPEEMARYNELRREDPRAARELLKRLTVELEKKEKTAADKK